MTDPATTVAVLAGGRSSRMGSDKAGVIVAGATMLEHVLAAAAVAGLEAVVVGGGGSVADLRPPHRGPLAGIEAALRFTGGDVVAVGVDQPWLLPDTLRALACRPEMLVVPRQGDELQWTCARYAHSCLSEVERILDERRAGPRHLWPRVPGVTVDEEEWRSWGEDGRSWFSADTGEAVTAGLAAYGRPGTLPA